MLKRSEKLRLFFDFIFNRKTGRWSNYFNLVENYGYEKY